MDYKPLPVGVDIFEKIITRGYYFIDKTWMIKELIDKKADVNLVTRPRRFGKTLNLSMLQYFFEDARDSGGVRQDNSYLFEGLKIMEAGASYLAHMGQYPVINLTLKSAKQPSWEISFAMLRREIAREYHRHAFVLKDGRLTAQERQRFIRMRDEETSYAECADAVRFLSDVLMKIYGRKTIILIDEYDVPLEHAFMEGFYQETISFIRSLFESAFKTSASLEFAVITGCLRISKESIFTGMNNLNMISILNKNYDEYFGFTEEEVRKICRDYKLEQKYELIKTWYNGYIFGDVNIYNPWSLILFINDLKTNEDEFPSPYWANTSSNSIVRKLIEMADENTKLEIEALIEGKHIEKPIHEDITYDEIYKTMDNLWNFMFFTGYFRKVRDWMDSEDNYFAELAIPNREVKYIFRRKILGWFEEKVKQKDRSRLFQALLDTDPEALQEEIADLLMETISFNDAYESFYHGFLTGIFLGMKGYQVRSNREGGRGRSDLVIRPVTRRKPAFVLEFKVAGKFAELEKKAKEALDQIEQRQYVRELWEDGYQTVYRYGIAFFGKDCLVKLG